MLFDYLREKRWIMISGKGGTGKTTTAAATAIKFAEEGCKTIVVSLDPAHSLSDSLMVEIGPSMKEISGFRNRLYALEFNPNMLFMEEKEKIERALREMGDLDEMMIPPEILELVGGGEVLPVEFAEGIGFIRLFEILKDSDFDKIIFDTAPTGHTLKLLELPDYLDSFLGKMIKIQLRLSSFFHNIKAFLRLEKGPDTAKQALEAFEKLKEIVNNLRQTIRDEKKTEFIVVTIPATMSIYESMRLIGELDAYEIPNRFIVVNMVRIYKGECSFSNSLAKMHRRNLEEIRKAFPDKNIIVVPFFVQEIRGIDSLKRIINYLESFTIEKAFEAYEKGVCID